MAMSYPAASDLNCWAPTQDYAESLAALSDGSVLHWNEEYSCPGSYFEVKATRQGDAERVGAYCPQPDITKMGNPDLRVFQGTLVPQRFQRIEPTHAGVSRQQIS